MSYRVVRRFHPTVIVLICACATTHAIGGTNTDLTTSLDVSSRVGLFASPVYVSSDESADSSIQQTGIATTQVIVTPRLAFAVSSKRTTFETAYQLELSNYVTRDDVFRLNFYQQAAMRLESRVSRTLNLVADITGRMGLLDYSRAIYTFDTEGDIAPNLPQTQELRFYNVSASTGLVKQWNRRTGSNLLASFNTRRAFGYDENDAPFPNYYHYSLEMGYDYAVTRRDLLTSNLSGAVVLFSPGEDFVPVQLTPGWRHDFSETARVNLSAGVMMAYQLNINNESSEDDPISTHTGNTGIYWLPVGNLTYRHIVNFKGRKTLSVNCNGGYNAYFDQVTASLRRRIVFGITGALTFPSEWTLAIRGTFSSLNTIDPVNSSGEVSTQSIEYPTAASIDANASYPITREFRLRFGVMSSARWSDFGDDDFRARAFEEFTVYLAISANKNHLEP